MNLSPDETRALAFVALLLLLATTARVARRGDPIHTTASAANLDSLRTASDSARRAAERRSKRLAPGERIRINTASADELERLPGVGRAMAARVVAAREAGGPFHDAQDVAARVTGLGRKRAENIASHIDYFSAAGSARRPPPASKAATREPRKTVPGRPIIDLNSASAAELVSLPGVGPVLAERIVAYRDSVGRFRTIGELRRVPGIGPATLARLKDYVRVVP